MVNGSLDAHLFQSKATVLNWTTRKLDVSFAPEIADFGMAAFVGRNFSRVLTTFRGAVGYLAPEWISGVAITPKVDEEGIHIKYILMTIVIKLSFFPVQAISKLHEGDVRSLVDPQLNGDFSLLEAERVCKVACWCIQENEFDRPTMNEVVRVLEGLQELDMPPMPRLLAALAEYSVVAYFDMFHKTMNLVAMIIRKNDEGITTQLRMRERLGLHLPDAPEVNKNSDI
uniref:Protein kinase domain-containing protein n=1 Tax=Oryza barthii TaxID=65489 RepID=A0A0D3FT87_9ORYZ